MVESKKACGHANPSITWGNQKWKGALASFNKIAKKINVVLINKKEVERKPDEISKADPKAWIRKYFKAASEK